MSKSKKEINIENNRFFKFFERKKRFLNVLRNFFAVIGITLFALIIIEKLLNLNIDRGWDYNSLEEEVIKIKGVRHHPFLDYIAPYRETENYCNDKDDAITIFLYGGSTMWGVGVHEHRDSVPSFLSKILCKKDINVNVTNYGIHGYNNLQETIKLFLHLKDGKSPDIVIFYDGVNEVRSGMPEMPFNRITEQVFSYYIHHQKPFPQIRGVLGNLYKGTNDVEVSFFAYDYLFSDHESEDNKYAQLAEGYINNVEIIKALEESYNFKSFFYWQPNLGTKKTLSEEEKELLENDYFKEKAKEYRKGYYFFDKIFLKNGHYINNISNIFDDYNDTIYIDDCHKLPIGNKIVAERMAEDIIEYLNNKKYE